MVLRKEFSLNIVKYNLHNVIIINTILTQCLCSG